MHSHFFYFSCCSISSNGEQIWQSKRVRSSSANSSPASHASAKGALSNPGPPVTLRDLKKELAESVTLINQRVDAIIDESLEKLRIDIRSDFGEKIEMIESNIGAVELHALKAKW